MTVLSVRDARSKGYVRLVIDDGGERCVFTVPEREYRDIGSPRGQDNLTRDIFLQLFLADMRYRAKIKALNILSYGDNSEGMLKRKLAVAKIRADIIDEIVREMVSLGYIDSDRQIERLVFCEVNFHNTGPMKIIPKLVAKGYRKSDVTRVISKLEERGEIDFQKARERLLIQKLPQSASEEEKKKILYKNGYYVC